MPSRQNAARIDRAEWESYRTEIHNYYILEDKSLGDLISYMKETHNFHATKAQYERQFALWKFRKNLSSDDWKFVIARIEKRKREGKENELFVDGFRVPPKRIQKEISRHSRPNETAASEEVQTPEGISVRTPQAHPASNISLENLPWIKFQNHIESRVSIGDILNFGNTNRQGPPSVVQLGPSIQESELFSIPGTLALASVQPVSGLSGTTAEKDLVETIPSISQLPAAILESQKSITLHGSVNQHSLLQLVRFAFYLASNDLLSDELAKKLLQFIIESKQESALASLFKEKMPTIEVFARFTFKHALFIQNTNIARICLQSGADPNLPLKTAKGDLYTPLEISLYVCGNIELTKALLDAGAHSNDLSTLHPARFDGTALAAITALLNVKVAQALLDLSRQNNTTGFWSGDVLTAAAMGNVEPIQTLFRLGVSVSSIRGLGEIALVAAAGNGDIELVQILLESGADINAIASIWGKSKKRTALVIATANGHTDLVQILLDAGADVNAPPGQGGTALQVAAEIGDTELVRILLDAGANVNAPPARGESGRTALQAAAESGDIALVRILMDAGADINAPPASGIGGMTALQAAADGGDIELVQILLDAGADVNAPPAYFYGRTALQAAANAGVIEVVQILLGAGANANGPPAGKYGRSALYAAARGGDIELVRILLLAGADVNAPIARGKGKTALRAAAKAGNIELVQILLDAGANVDASHSSGKGGTALQVAAERGDIELVRILLGAGAIVNSLPSLVLGAALQAAVVAERNGIELVQILLDAGADVNASADGDKKRTALQVAVLGGNIELVRALLNAGADANAPSRMTALREAVAGNRIDLVQLLLDAGADINASATAFYGRTVLQAAAVNGNTKMVQYLLSENADVNAPPAQAGGVTALQGAAINGHLAIAILLLQAGADVTAAPAAFMGRSALEGAAENGRLDMVQLLLNASAGTEISCGRDFSKAAVLAERGGHRVIAKLLRDYPD